MKVTLLQLDLKWQDAEANRRQIERLIEGDSLSTDLVILPEMFTTGFCTAPALFAEEPQGATFRWMRSLARRIDAAVAGSLIVRDGEHYFNRLYFVAPDGSFYEYDKRHLFSFAAEDRQFTAGHRRVVAEFRGARILLQTCYDLRFPAFSRNTADAPYDLALYAANWPVKRIDVWDVLLRARAIENQCCVAGVNRVGADPSAQYSGHTAVVDERGTVVARADDNRQQTVVATLDLQALAAFRKKFPVLDDADRIIDRGQLTIDNEQNRKL
jgi:predicted amidohydrolase